MGKEFLCIFTGSQHQLINHPGLDTVLRTKVELQQHPCPTRENQNTVALRDKHPRFPSSKEKQNSMFYLVLLVNSLTQNSLQQGTPTLLKVYVFTFHNTIPLGAH